MADTSKTEVFLCPQGKHYILRKHALKDEIGGQVMWSCPIDGAELVPTDIHGEKTITYLRHRQLLPPVGSGTVVEEQ